MQADRGGLVEDERCTGSAARLVVDQDRNQPVRIEREVLGRLVRRLLAIDVAELERRADLFEDDVDDEAGVARGIVKSQHEGDQSWGARSR